jgi:hypothetical protein
MTYELVKKELKRFLSSSKPEVLAIHGKWGVGKTYSWQKILQEASQEDEFCCKRYAYVSLFGIGTLDKLRSSLFEQSIDRGIIGKGASVETFYENIQQMPELFGRKSWSFLSKIALNTPLGRLSSSPVLEALSFLSIRDSLICLDDIERRSKSLSPRDVLGLVSFLKEQRNCKVVFLLNDGEEGLEEYEQYREKVVDIELLFDPTAKECSEIVFFNKEQIYKQAGEFSVQLELKNIRTLKKIERLIDLIHPKIADLEPEVSHQIVQSLVLYAWSYYRAGDEKIPWLDYIQNIGYKLHGLEGNDTVSEQEGEWNTRLRNYGYLETDGLDDILTTVVKTGYVNDESFEKAAQKKNDEIIATKASGSVSAAWHLFHDSFNDDKELVVSTLCERCKANMKYMSFYSLDGIVVLLRKLGEEEKIVDIIASFMQVNEDDPEPFDSNNRDFSEIKDPELREAVETLYRQKVVVESARDVLLRLVGKNGWDQEAVTVLSKTSSNEYYELFKSEKGRNLTEIVDICLRFGRFENANERHKQIAENATQALRRIGRESDINRLRVRSKFGIEIDDDV